MKLVVGLGNPGLEYETTRHNVGWWVADRLKQEWGLGAFRKEGAAWSTEGRVAGETVRLLKPTTYMNRSGAALVPFLRNPEFVPTRDLLVVVDDVSLPVGRFRFRAQGSAGGHNGLKSIESFLRSRDYPRLRVGVGPKPDKQDLADFVLADFEPEDEARVVELLPTLTDAVREWVEHGIDTAMRLNR